MPGGRPGDSDPKREPEVVVMRYFFNAEIEPTTLKGALTKVKGVEKVELKAADRTVHVTWSGKCDDLAALEAAAEKAAVPAYLLSHAHVVFGAKAKKDPKPEQLYRELIAISGVRHAHVLPGALDLHTDLERLAILEVRGAGTNAGFEVLIKTHVWMEADVTEGEAEKVAKELSLVKGVLVVKTLGERVMFWALKAVTDDQVKKAAEKVGAKLGAIEKP